MPLDYALLILRLGLGVIFTAHGLHKSFGMFSGPGVKGFAAALSSLGFYPAVFWAYIGACTMLAGGICLITGFGARAAAALILIFITVAAYKVHLARGLFLSSGGFEYNLLIACACIAIIILGPGKFSIK